MKTLFLSLIILAFIVSCTSTENTNDVRNTPTFDEENTPTPSVTLTPPTCDIEWQVSPDRKFICNQDKVAKECTNSNMGEKLLVQGFFEYTCDQYLYWSSPCETEFALYPTQLYDILGTWYICSGSILHQCNKQSENGILLDDEQTYICKPENHGWERLNSDDQGGNENLDDSDNDGVLDHDPQGGENFDHELDSASSCEVYNYDNYPIIEKLGVQVDPECESTCKNIAGATGGADGPLNLHIIFVSCNYDQRTKEVFDRVTGIISDALVNRIEPYKSNTDKFKITSLYADRLKVGKSDVDLQELDICKNSETIAQTASDCYDTLENTAFVVLGHNVESLGDGFTLTGSCGTKDSNGIYNPFCLLNIDPTRFTGIVRTTIHELGHSYRFGHPFKDFDTGRLREPDPFFYDTNIWGDNDFYAPDIPLGLFEQNNLIDPLQPCPIWDEEIVGPEFSKWILNDPKGIRCNQYFEGYKDLFAPWADGDVMGYESGNDQDHNPIDRKLIDDMLNIDGGYQSYMLIKYPHRCSEIDEKFISTFDEPPKFSLDEIKNKCFIKECSYIPKGHTDEEYRFRLQAKTGINAASAREACCNQITDDESKKADCNIG